MSYGFDFGLPRRRSLLSHLQEEGIHGRDMVQSVINGLPCNWIVWDPCQYVDFLMGMDAFLFLCFSRGGSTYTSSGAGKKGAGR